MRYFGGKIWNLMYAHVVRIFTLKRQKSIITRRLGSRVGPINCNCVYIRECVCTTLMLSRELRSCYVSLIYISWETRIIVSLFQLKQWLDHKWEIRNKQKSHFSLLHVVVTRSIRILINYIYLEYITYYLWWDKTRNEGSQVMWSFFAS